MHWGGPSSGFFRDTPQGQALRAPVAPRLQRRTYADVLACWIVIGARGSGDAGKDRQSKQGEVQCS